MDLPLELNRFRASCRVYVPPSVRFLSPLLDLGAICSSEVSFEADFEHFEGQARHFDFETIGAMLFDDTILMS